MSDLYTVLKQSIIERNLSSAAARQEVYGQARTAMIRQLWTFDPPLSEADIEDRIGHFDTAVEQIESDLVQTFERAQPRGGTPQKRSVGRTVPVYEGYDEAADYTPAVGARPEAPPEPQPRRADRSAQRRLRGPAEAPPEADSGRSLDEIEQALAHRSAAIEDALRFDRDPREAAIDEDEADRRLAERFRPEGRTRRDERPAEAADDDGYETSREREDEYFAPYEEESEEPAPKRSPSLWLRESWGDLSERGRVTVLLSAIGTLAVVLVVLGVTLMLPSGSRPSPGEVIAPTTADGPAVVQSYVVFDGRDPTVFEAASGNPIRFEGDTGGGFARVSSSAADAGVRVTIGPGLANRLAGRTIRLTLVVRSARENGAVGLRFAYQSGVALSHWQTANLSPDYVALALTWRVPTQRTDPTGDHILIEPGIPGDGTGADIKSIKIELLG